jgi:hypothetical protein
VVGVPDPKWGERPLLVVVPKPGAAPGPGLRSSVLAYMAGHPDVAKFAVPDDVMFVDAIPYGATGKARGRRARRPRRRRPRRARGACGGKRGAGACLAGPAGRGRPAPHGARRLPSAGREMPRLPTLPKLQSDPKPRHPPVRPSPHAQISKVTLRKMVAAARGQVEGQPQAQQQLAQPALSKL